MDQAQQRAAVECGRRGLDVLGAQRDLPDGMLERQLEVETPASVASARDAEIDLKVADDGQSTLTVMQGTADFATPFGQCSVRVGTASIGARGAGCTAPQPANAAAAAGWKQAVSQ